MTMIRLSILILFVAVLPSCGPVQDTHEEPQSMLHFIPHRTTQNISLRYARQPVFKVCTRGATNPKVEQWSVQAVLTWLRAARKIDDRVTRAVEVSCQSPHLVIEMRNGSGVSHAYPGHANFYTGKPFGELVHELGHALAGLSDTYQGRQAGNCKPGQPQSNMCWGAYGPRANPGQYSGLWPDDILGVHSQHKKLFPDARPPVNAAAIDAEAPIDFRSPWPEDGEEDHSDDSNHAGRMFVALASSPSAAATLYLSTPKSAQTVILCVNVSDLNACRRSSERIVLQAADSRPDRMLFVAPEHLPLSPNHNIYAFALENSGQLIVQRGFRVQAVN